MNPLFPLSYITQGSAMSYSSENNHISISFNLMEHYKDTPKEKVEVLLAGSFEGIVLLQEDTHSTFDYNYMVIPQEGRK